MILTSEQLDARAREISSRVLAIGRGGLSRVSRETGLPIHVVRAACVRAGTAKPPKPRAKRERGSITARREYGDQVRTIVDEIGVTGLRDILGVTSDRAIAIARWVGLSPSLTDDETLAITRAYAIARAYLLEVEPRDILAFRARAMRIRARRVEALISDQI